jgi:predicted aldo/keto reductase-like oxidoreductase
LSDILTKGSIIWQIRDLNICFEEFAGDKNLNYFNMGKFNRRKFLKTGIAGAAGVAVLSNEYADGKPLQDKKNVICRTLGKTGIIVPVIGMGVMNANNPALVKAAMDQGITFFDTANSYQNGRNEEMLGHVFKEYPRNSFTISTKVKSAGVDMNTGIPTKETTPEDFLEKFNTSLKRLQMDYVDILYMHLVGSPEMVNYKPVVRVMQNLKKEGRTKFIGISTHNLPLIIDAIIKADIWDVVETTYNFLNTEVIRANSVAPVEGMELAIKKAGDAGLGIVAMKALAGGGFLDKERTKPINTTAAIKWVLSNPNVHTTIPGMTSFDQLDSNIKMLTDITLNDNEKKDLITAQAETGLFCTACKNCVPGCKLNLPVPDIMRAYMYAYGYKNTALAHSLLVDLSAGDDPCKNCDSCTAVCSRNFNLKEKITDVSRLVNVPVEFIS